MSCPTCLRPTPQRNGDPEYGRCPACGSTLGYELDDGTPTSALVPRGWFPPMKEHSSTIENSGFTPYTRTRR